MSPAKCVGQVYDVPRTPLVTDGVLATAGLMLEIEPHSELWNELDCGRAVDRNVLLRVLRI